MAQGNSDMDSLLRTYENRKQLSALPKFSFEEM